MGDTDMGAKTVVYQADAVEWLRTLDDESVDLVLTDPAYESLEKHRAKGTTTRLKHSKASSNDWFDIFPNRRYGELFEELYRVLKRHRHCYVFCDQETLFHVKPAGEAAGFKFWKPIVWDKGKIGMGYHYRARYEFVCFFEKGKRRLADLAIPDVLQYDRVHHRHAQYPTEKPVDLCRVFVGQSTDPGHLVIDPFCGSGSSLVAAALAGREVLGCDTSPRAREVAVARLNRVLLHNRRKSRS